MQNWLFTATSFFASPALLDSRNAIIRTKRIQHRLGARHILDPRSVHDIRILVLSRGTLNLDFPRPIGAFFS